jgi:hypothetical protein
MHRYFFDLVSRGRAQYDYTGREFRTPGQAREMAELIALDLACASADEGWAGWSVEVRTALGQQHFCIPVRAVGAGG